jgi:hypothetical protein
MADMPPRLVQAESSNLTAMASATVRALALTAGGDDAFIAAADAAINRWYVNVKVAAVRCRWTTGDEADVAALVAKLGFSKLVHRLTGRDALVLLALLPQLPSIAHHGPSLAEALSRWLGVPIRYIAHVPRHHYFERSDQSLLRDRYSRLGVDLVLGNSMYEHGSTIALEVDLRAGDAADRLAADGWAKVDGRDVTLTDKLELLIETLVSPSLRVEWRWLFVEFEVERAWRLGAAAQHRLGLTTMLASFALK